MAETNSSDFNKLVPNFESRKRRNFEEKKIRLQKFKHNPNSENEKKEVPEDSMQVVLLFLVVFNLVERG